MKEEVLEIKTMEKRLIIYLKMPIKDIWFW